MLAPHLSKVWQQRLKDNIQLGHSPSALHAQDQAPCSYPTAQLPVQPQHSARQKEKALQTQILFCTCARSGGSRCDTMSREGTAPAHAMRRTRRPAAARSAACCPGSARAPRGKPGSGTIP